MAPRVALYGATGYTGHLVARELGRRGHEPVLCGRNPDRLRRMAADLGVGWETRAAAVDDPHALRGALRGADVVINCAGPFTYYGAPVIAAAIDVGAHYLDTTGEQPYMRRVYEHVDEPARSRGVAVVPAMGFDYVPGDLIAALAARGQEPLEMLEVAYCVSDVAVTRGTMRSVLEMLAGEGVEYTGGSFRPAGRPPLGERFDFGGDVGELPVMRYPGGEVVTVPRHVRTRSVRLRWATPSFVPAPQLAPWLPAALPVAGLLLRTPLAGVADAVIERLPEGPGEDDRRASRFTIVAEAQGKDGTRSRAVVRGEDVYGLTAAIIVRGAELLAEDDFAASGALAPAEAFDPEALLLYLGDHGLRFEVEGADRDPART